MREFDNDSMMICDFMISLQDVYTCSTANNVQTVLQVVRGNFSKDQPRLQSAEDGTVLSKLRILLSAVQPS